MESSDAGTSSRCEYQVFLSFRGPDTREGFTDFLFQSLTDAGIHVFLDDEELRVGEKIGDSLERAIDNSRIYIPVFSKNYASSQWCLCELEQIVANTSKSEGEKEILPIFFDVEPNDVKLKTALYTDAILSLQSEKKLSNEQVDAWREALKKVDEIKGWEVKSYKGQGKLIKLVVDAVVEKLKTKHRREPEHLVGIDDRVEKIRELLDVDSGGVRFIQIHGMGGIGKTTLARVVFNQLSSHFRKYCCFLDDVRVKSSPVNLVELQKELLSEISGHGGTESIKNIDYGMKRIEEVLSNKRVLIVLDDIDNSEQVEYLVGKSTLCSGSRILVTTRNKEVLQIHRPKSQVLLYEMEVMSSDRALQLFNKHAFGGGSPSNEFSNLSRQIVFATGGLPLTLEVVGSFLYHKTQELWEEALDKLRKAPPENVFEKLKISYDALTFKQKQIFLDIACFFIGENKTNAIYMWEDCGLFPKDGVNVLNSKCLIKIEDDGNFWMHDQLRDFGRQIVREENHTIHQEHSRLWIHEEILNVITTKEVKKKVLGLNLDLSRNNPEVVIKSEEIARFENLRYLRLNGGTFAGDLADCLTQLRWLFWGLSFQKSGPTNMQLKNVVILQFSMNRVVDDSKLQNSIEMASKLKVLSLCHCDNITTTPDFSGCPKLERLTFNNCCKLSKIDGSIGKLKCLTHLTIEYCDRLIDLPKEIGDLVNLKHFCLRQCRVEKLPDSIWKLESLCEVSFLYCYLPELATSWELPNAIGMLQNLEVLRVSSSCLKGHIPSGIGSLPFLKILILSSGGISEVPKTISMLPCLQRLELHCNIQELPVLPTSLTHLRVSSTSLRVIPDLSNLINLVHLDLSNGFYRGQEHEICTGDLEWIGRLSELKELRLKLLDVPAPTTLASLSQLQELGLSGLDLRSLMQLPPSLSNLSLDVFDSLFLSFTFENLMSLVITNYSVREIQLRGLQFKNLTELFLARCGPLKRFMLSNMRKLKKVKVRGCPKLVEIQFVGVFDSLEILGIDRCNSLGRLAFTGEVESANESISCGGQLILLSRVSNKLQSLDVTRCSKTREIQVVGTWESCEHLGLEGFKDVQSLQGLSNLKNLKNLVLWFNDGLRFVEGLDELEFLNKMIVAGSSLWEKWIDVASTKLPNHCHIHVRFCKKNFLGSLESYKHYKEQEQERDFEQELEQESEQELQPRRRLGRVWFQCLSFNSLLHRVLPFFFPSD